MELGKLQKFWLEQLRKHPERQLKGKLGEGTLDDYKACCLGELHLCNFRLKDEPFPFIGVRLFQNLCNSDYRNNDVNLSYIYEEYGLRGGKGEFKKSITFKDEVYENLASLNDNGATWPEIADIIEANPENVFTKSV